MPPPLLSSRAFNPALTSTEFSTQWSAPGEVFSVLLILGGDVVARALAQLAGGSAAPVAFSFGWVSYSVSALVSAVGENRLMPLPDYPCKVINGSNGYVRDNTSWVLGRILRDFGKWKDPKVAECVQSLRSTKRNEQKIAGTNSHDRNFESEDRTMPVIAGLCVSIYKASNLYEPGHPRKDVIHYSGYAIAAVQLGIAAIPFIVSDDWGIFLITACGILISFMTCSLPQWSKEKWACRRNSNKTVILTRGNGSQHAIVILGGGIGLDLEDLAAGPGNMDVSTSYLTRVAVAALCAVWILLLISAAGLKENTWFLLAVGGIGILHNIIVAGWARDPGAFGVPLAFEEVVGHTRVMTVLYQVEEKYPNVGRSMLDIFFPGRLEDEEKAKWDAYRIRADKRKPRSTALDSVDTTVSTECETTVPASQSGV